MLILTMRTDKPEAEIGLFDDAKELAYETWQAHRQLAETIHQKIQSMLVSQGLELGQLQGIVMYKGPGSFTGLRIGLSVGNAIAGSYHLRVSGQTGNAWIQQGIQDIVQGNENRVVLPEYGAPVHITAQKK
jgi:tRNA threonylcarbamoyladenosine biosynthesis protein TsaB